MSLYQLQNNHLPKTSSFSLPTFVTMYNTLPLALGLCQLLSLASALSPLSVVPTAGGFTRAFKGWTGFPLQAFKTPGFPYGESFLTESNLRAQATVLAQKLLASGYEYLMIDSGWSQGSDGDQNGRIIPDRKIFSDFPGFISALHGMGLKVGIYVVPGVFVNDYKAGKPIFGTPFKVSDVAPSPPNSPPNTPPPGNNQGRIKIDFDSSGRTRDAGRAWVKSVVDQFAGW